MKNILENVIKEGKALEKVTGGSDYLNGKLDAYQDVYNNYQLINRIDNNDIKGFYFQNFLLIVIIVINIIQLLK